MKYRDILTLVNTGALQASSHDVPVEDALRLIRFKSALRKAYGELQARLKEVGNDPRSEVLNEALLEETVVLKGVTPMSFESFHALARENRSVLVELFDKEGILHTNRFDPFTISEDALEGILWNI